VVLIILVLTLVVTVPAAASKPTEVSGRWTDSAYTRPPEFNPNGPSNCSVTVGFWHEWGDGSFRGTSVSEWRIFAHGPCATSRPGMDPANLTATAPLRVTFAWVSGTAMSAREKSIRAALIFVRSGTSPIRIQTIGQWTPLQAAS